MNVTALKTVLSVTSKRMVRETSLPRHWALTFRYHCGERATSLPHGQPGQREYS